MASHLPHGTSIALAGIAILILAFDVLQYVTYTAGTFDSVEKTESSLEDVAWYETSSWKYKAAGFFSFAKFLLLASGGLVLVWSFIEMARSL